MHVNKIRHTTILRRQNSSNRDVNSPEQYSFEDITPKELLDKYTKGEYPKVQNLKDKVTEELDALAQKYKQSMTIENKRKILDKELDILFEELKNPELTLARNYEEIVFVTALDKNIKKEETEDLLRLINVTGLHREESLEKEFKNQPIKKEHIDILKDAFIKANEENYAGKRTKDLIGQLMVSYKENYPELSDKICETLKILYKHTNNQELKNNLNSYCKEHTLDEYLNAFNKKESDCIYFLDVILNDIDRKNEKVHKLVSDLLKSDNTPSDIKRRVILGAGKFRSPENFEIIKKIALDINEKDIRKREFAIQSTALYLKDKPQEVKQIMHQIANESSIFAPLGRILSDKITGNYHSQTNRELKYAGIKGERAKDFKYRFKNFYFSNQKLSGKKINDLERNTLPFINQLKKIYRMKKYIIIGKDETITKYLPEITGIRYFFPGTILNSGAFFDAFDGLNIRDYNLMNTQRVGNRQQENSVAHEIAHTFHDMFDDEDFNTVEKLYQNAIKENRIMDYYAETNAHEYFAQGFDAYISPYKPHKYILYNSPLAHTVYELMDKDPDLYKFIKYVLKKYH